MLVREGVVALLGSLMGFAACAANVLLVSVDSGAHPFSGGLRHVRLFPARKAPDDKAGPAGNVPVRKTARFRVLMRNPPEILPGTMSGRRGLLETILPPRPRLAGQH